MEEDLNFADVLLPVPIPGSFTYRIPRSSLGIVFEGTRVVVQFGRKRVLTGIVGKLHNKPPENYNELKNIIEVLDLEPIVNTKQIEFFRWIARYYMCTIGQVLNAALPSGLKLSSESKLQLNPSFIIEGATLSEEELDIVEALQTKNSLNYEMVAALINKKNPNPIIKSLIKKEAIILFEELKDRYRPKIEKRIKLLDPSKTVVNKWVQQIEKREGQLNLLLKYLSLVPVLQDTRNNHDGISQKELLVGNSTSSLNTLVKNGLFEKFDAIIPRFPNTGSFDEPTHLLLSPAQQVAKDQIMSSFESHDTVLLHGITGSGKTEIFIQLIRETLENGSQVLYLLPEIALSTQMIQRLRLYFGDKVGIYHSRFSDSERVEIWKGVLEGRYEFVVGVRSAIFLPFDRLGLIIVDEEHEFSYKQFEPAPRYQARDCALVLAKIHQCKTVLGTATPSIETYWNALMGKYALVNLDSRYGAANMPDIELVDIRPDRKALQMRGEFTPFLFTEIKRILEERRQVIVFQNRRGYAPYVHCNECGWIPKCINCAVSLTYHLYSNELKCHYCGHRESLPHQCAECHSSHIESMSFGTQKLEEDLQTLIPEARVTRIDYDSTRQKKSYEEIISQIENKQVDIIVGTQMISKGFDFESIALVIILGADQIIHFPDFRAHERAYSLMTQVSGRTGRRAEKGLVYIQSSQAENFILQCVKTHNYGALYQKEIADRERYHYPPFFRLIKVIVKDESRQKAMDMAWNLRKDLLRQFPSNSLSGPNPSLIFRIRNKYQFELLIRIHRSKTNLHAWKRYLAKAIDHVQFQQRPKTSRIIVDVDPF